MSLPWTRFSGPADVTWGFQVFAAKAVTTWCPEAIPILKDGNGSNGSKVRKWNQKTHQYVRYWSIYINIDHLESRVEMLTGPQQQDCLVATIFWTKPTHPVMVSLVLDRTFAWWLWPHHLWQGRQTVHDWVRWRMTNHWTLLLLLSLLKHIKAMSNNMKMFIMFISLDRKDVHPYRSR